MQALNQTNVIPTLCVPTMKGLTSAAVLMDMKEVVEIVQVNCYRSLKAILLVKSTFFFCFLELINYPLKLKQGKS